MQQSTRRTVLVTGASSGIGFATAHALDRAGWRVFASVRREADTVHLKRALAEDARTLVMDVTRPETIAAAVAELSRETGGRLDALVNNAGIVLMGPMEGLSREALRAPFDVNVFGLLDVTRACLPLLRRTRGRIVNVGSISGRVSWPFNGVYAASKHAVEALSDSLRIELGAFGIRTSVIEPGAIDTPIWRKPTPESMRELDHLEPEAAARYRRLFAIVDETLGLIAKRAAPVEPVARTIVRALDARFPRARYVVALDARLQLAYNAIPTAIRDRVMLALMHRVLYRPRPERPATPAEKPTIDLSAVRRNGAVPTEPQPA